MTYSSFRSDDCYLKDCFYSVTSKCSAGLRDNDEGSGCCFCPLAALFGEWCLFGFCHLTSLSFGWGIMSVICFHFWSVGCTWAAEEVIPQCVKQLKQKPSIWEPSNGKNDVLSQKNIFHSENMALHSWTGLTKWAHSFRFLVPLHHRQKASLCKILECCSNVCT